MYEGDRVSGVICAMQQLGPRMSMCVCVCASGSTGCVVVGTISGWKLNKRVNLACCCCWWAHGGLCGSCPTVGTDDGDNGRAMVWEGVVIGDDRLNSLLLCVFNFLAIGTPRIAGDDELDAGLDKAIDACMV